jgi:hypothetical protein
VADTCGQSNVFSGSIMSAEFFEHVITLKLDNLHSTMFPIYSLIFSLYTIK